MPSSNFQAQFFHGAPASLRMPYAKPFLTRSRGVTLLEVMLSSSLLCLLLLLAFTFGGRLLDFYQVSHRKVFLTTEAQKVFHRLEEDLEAAFFCSKPPLNLSYERFPEGKQGELLRFYAFFSKAAPQAPAESANVLQQLCRIEYALIGENGNEASPAAALRTGLYRTAASLGPTNYQSGKAVAASERLSPYVTHCQFHFYKQAYDRQNLPEPVSEANFDFPGGPESPYAKGSYKLVWVDIVLTVADLPLVSKKPRIHYSTTKNCSPVLSYTHRVVLWADPFVLPL